MYSEFFGFKELPFSITPNPRFIFLSKNHREAFAHLLYGINNHVGFIELTGEVGSGKTTILRALLGQLDDEKHRTALIFNPRLSADELLRSVCREFGVQGGDGSIDELLHSLNHFLLKESAAGRTVVLVIDEAQNLEPAVLEQIRLISNLETNTHKLIQIVLSGQPELGKVLEQDDLRQLSQRITVRFHLHPLDFEDLQAYIDHRLEIAGGWRAVTFTPGALKRVFKYSQGLPRLINVLCDRALLVAFTEETREISSRLVAKAIKELRREATSSRGRWLWQAAAVVVAAMALIFAGFLIGQQTQPVPQKPVVRPATAQQTAETARRIQEAFSKQLMQRSEQESAVHGFNELARLWNVRPVVKYSGAKTQSVLEKAAARRGLKLFQFSGAFPDLLHINAPCLLELRLPGMSESRFLALTAQQGEKLVIKPRLAGVESVTPIDLKGIWTGRAYIPWRNSHNLPNRINPGAGGAEVRQLQKMLTEAGMFKGAASGRFDAATQSALKAFQASNNLPTDGILGPQTLFFLYRVSGASSNPSLTESTRS